MVMKSITPLDHHEEVTTTSSETVSVSEEELAIITTKISRLQTSTAKSHTKVDLTKVTVAMQMVMSLRTKKTLSITHIHICTK